MTEKLPAENQSRPTNPFLANSSAATPPPADARTPRRLAAGRGGAWLSAGWAMVRASMGNWVGLTVIFGLLMLIGSAVPIFGQIAINILAPVFIGGVMIACRSQEKGDGVKIEHLFAGFKENFGSLAMSGFLYLVGAVVIVVFIAVGIAIFVGIDAIETIDEIDKPSTTMALGMMLSMMLGLLLLIPLFMAIWFAPALVVFQQLSAIDALKLSLHGCLRNMAPFLIYGVLTLILAIVASIPLGLGWLLLLPTLFCSTYVAYREIFVEAEGA